jgi:hypothetical protein
MTDFLNTAGPLLVVLGLALVLMLLMKFAPSAPTGFEALKARKLVTGNEAEFLQRIRRAAEPLGLEVLPQVAMSALLDVALSEGHPAYWQVRRMFSMKTVDYVVCRGRSLDVLAVVELDDKTHDSKRAKDAHRDAMLAAAGIRTVRWDSRSKPSVEQIGTQLRSLLAETNKSQAV